MKIKFNKIILLSIVTSSIFTISATRVNTHKHVVDQIVETVVSQPNCEKDGQKITTYTCSCGQLMKQVTSTIPALGHDLVHHLGLEATCTSEGYSDYDTCSRCDYSTYRLIPAHGHHIDPNHTKSTNYKEPNCTESGGYDIYAYCVDCGQYYFKEHVYLEPFGHSFYDVDYEAPSCENDGHSSGVECALCGYTTVTSIPAVGHSYSKYSEEYVTTPTCTENGLVNIYGYCEVCQEYSAYPIGEKVVPALGHSYVHYEHVDATCLTPGHKEYVQCERCGDNNYKYIPEKGHTAGDFTITYSSTNKKYYKTVTCNDCGITISSTPITNYSTGISLGYGTLNLDVDERMELVINTDHDYFVYSTDPKVANYSDGFIYAHDSGVACVYFHVQDTGEVVGVYVTVGGGEQFIDFELSSSTMYVGRTVSILNYSTNLDDVQFISSNTSVAVIQTREIYAKGQGTTYITAFSKSTGIKKSILLTVYENSIDVLQNSVTCFLGETLKLRQYFTSTSPDTFTYTSSNTSVATVDSSGTVSGIKKGSVIITINSKRCGSATIQVTVREKVEHYIDITMSNYKSYFTETYSIDGNKDISVRLTIKEGYIVTTRISVDVYFIDGVLSSEQGGFSIYPGSTTGYVKSHIGGHNTYRIYAISGRIVYYT